MKAHFSIIKLTDKPAGRTLFVANVPPYVDESAIRTAFSLAGNITNVIFSEKPADNTPDKDEPQLVASDSGYFDSPQQLNKFKIAYIVFDSTATLNKALSLDSLTPVQSGGKKLLFGNDKWWSEYVAQIPDKNKLQLEIDEFMQQYDKDQELAKSKEEENDGWTTVKAGTKKGFGQTESVISKLEDKIQRGKKRKQLDNFYTFQFRDAKRTDVVSLRRKYQADQDKIEVMKKSRKFKPF